MRLRIISDTIGLILYLYSFTFFAPLIVAILYEEPWLKTIISFLIPFIITFSIAYLLRRYGKGYSEHLRDMEGLAVVSIAWLAIALVGSLPFILSLTLTNPIDAFFESMSGFTTTGATVMTDIEGASHSILFWRSLIQWLGGMGIIVISVVLLSKLIGTPMQLFRAEISGPVYRLKPRLAQTAQLLWGIYFLFTGIQIALLKVAGMGLFDATCHGLSGVATGGFSTKSMGIAHFDSPLIEGIMVVFMVIGGTSFVLHYYVLTGKVKRLLKDPEFRTYITIIVGGSIFVTFDLLLNAGYSGAEALRYAIFNVASINTASGFATDDFSLWPGSSQFVLLILMLIGGCVGSTAGGIKVIRVIILMKLARKEVRNAIHPKAVFPIKVGGKTVSDDILKGVTAMFIVYLFLFAISVLLIGFLVSDMISGVSAVATCMGTVGPGLGEFGPFSNFSSLNPLGKLWLSFLMWFGRLELFAGFVLFSPRTWRST